MSKYLHTATVRFYDGKRSHSDILLVKRAQIFGECLWVLCDKRRSGVLEQFCI